jgi:hypothetical protein
MSEIEWHIEKRKVSDLKAYHKNPRRLTKDQAAHLKTSLDKFGLIDKPCINLDNTVIGGHQRLNVWSGDEIEVNVPSRMLEDKEVEECNIRLNANQGEFDMDILANEFDLDDLLVWGVEAVASFEFSEALADEEPSRTPRDRKVKCPKCSHEFKPKKTID